MIWKADGLRHTYESKCDICGPHLFTRGLQGDGGREQHAHLPCICLTVVVLVMSMEVAQDTGKQALLLQKDGQQPAKRAAAK